MNKKIRELEDTIIWATKCYNQTLDPAFKEIIKTAEQQLRRLIG